MAKRSYTDEQRREAIQLYAEAGPCEVERALGIPKGTVTKWAQAAGVRTEHSERTAEATAQHQQSWAERRARVADAMGEVAELAVGRARRELNGGSARNARDCAATAAVMADKAQLLSGGVTTRTADASARGEVLANARNHALSLVRSA